MNTLLNLLFMASAHAYTPFQPVVGLTTSLDDKTCVQYDGDIYEKEPPIDYFSQECVGLGGWRVQAYGGDSRAYIKLLKDKQVLDLADDMQSGGQFPTMGGVVEWRVKMVQGQSAEPFALITDVTGQDPENINHQLGRVILVKLGAEKSCVIGHQDFDPGKSETQTAAWAKARLIDVTQVKCP